MLLFGVIHDVKRIVKIYKINLEKLGKWKKQDWGFLHTFQLSKLNGILLNYRLIDNVKEIKENLSNVIFGNIDAWLIFNLTGKALTDVTNASRTFLMNLYSLKWD
jgi:glycerol kinase